MKLESLQTIENDTEEVLQTIRFCDECSNILFPFYDEQYLGYKCQKPSCGFQIKNERGSKEANLISKKEFLKEKKLAIDPSLSKDPTMPREMIICLQCNYPEASFFINTDIEDTRIELIYICGNPECGFAWKKQIEE